MSNVATEYPDITVYKSGNSNVVTIPSGLDVKPGDRFVLNVKKDLLILKKQLPGSSQAQIKKLHSLIGNAPGSTKGLDKVEKLEKQLEGIYG